MYTFWPVTIWPSVYFQFFLLSETFLSWITLYTCHFMRVIIPRSGVARPKSRYLCKFNRYRYGQDVQWVQMRVLVLGFSDISRHHDDYKHMCRRPQYFISSIPPIGEIVSFFLLGKAHTILLWKIWNCHLGEEKNGCFTASLVWEVEF